MLPVDIYAEIFQYLISAAVADFKKFIIKYKEKLESNTNIENEIRLLKKIYILPLATTCKNAAAALKLFDEGGRNSSFLSKFAFKIDKKMFYLENLKNKIPENTLTKVIFPSDFLSEKVESAAIISPFSFVKRHIYIYNLHFSESEKINYSSYSDRIIFKINFDDIDIVLNNHYAFSDKEVGVSVLTTSKIEITSLLDKNSIITNDFGKESFLWPTIKYFNKNLISAENSPLVVAIRRAAADHILKKLEKKGLKKIRYYTYTGASIKSKVKAADIIYGIYCNL